MSEAAALEGCLAGGGVAVFPSDTVYGLACDPQDAEAVTRLYALKRRRPDKPSAVMYFSLEVALAALPELGPRVREALRALLPGPVGVLLPNPRGRFPLACVGDQLTLGLRVPGVPALARVRRPVLQTSANLAGGPDPRRLADVPQEILAAVDLCIDGDALPGTPSTLVDLRELEAGGGWRVVRPGAVGEAALRAALGAPDGRAGAGAAGMLDP